MGEIFLLWFGRLCLLLVGLAVVWWFRQSCGDIWSSVEERIPVLALGLFALVICALTFAPPRINYLKYPPVIRAMNAPAPDQISRCLEGKINIPICRK